VEGNYLATTYPTFPKEFHKGFFQDFSRDFFRILLVSLVLHVVLMIVLINLPDSNVDRSFELESRQGSRYVNFIAQRQVMYEQKLAERQRTTPASQSATSTRTAADRAETTAADDVGTTVGDAPAERGETSEAAGSRSYPRSRSREQIVRDASKIGILGLITSGAGGGTTPDLSEVMGEGGQATDVNDVISGLDAVRSRESAGGGEEGGREVRGERTTEGAGITEMVEELGESKSTNIARTGELVVDDLSALTNEGDVTRLAGRNPDDVSAVINSHLGAIQNLYEVQLLRNPNLRGKLVVRFTITPQGKITSVTVVSETLNDEQLINRITRRMLRWDDFGPVAASMGDAVFRQVFTFGF
jgi:hypothetical protein